MHIHSRSNLLSACPPPVCGRRSCPTRPSWESNGVEVGEGGGVGSVGRGVEWGADSVLVWDGVGDSGEAERDLGGMMLECTWMQ